MFLIKKISFISKEKLLDVTDFAVLGFSYNPNGCNYKSMYFH